MSQIYYPCWLILFSCLVVVALVGIKAFEHHPDGKIAFLFLTRGPMPLEDVWREFFRWRANSSHYSIYIHPHAGYRYPPTSFFHGREVIDNLKHVAWGGMSQVKAIKHLAAAALEDPLNEWFCVLSETCIPMVPFSKWYSIMTAHTKSIVNACPMDPIHMEVDTRWRPGLDTVGLKKQDWRKSATWVALIRKHALVFVNETKTEPGWEGVPCCDEHYLPTILAMNGLDDETTCTDGMTYINWESDRAMHPKLHRGEDISPELFAFMETPREVKKGFGFSLECSGYQELCHFAARKFAPSAKWPLLENLDLILSDDEFPYAGNPWDHHADKVRISGDGQRYWMIENGVRRLIPDNTTFDSLHIPRNVEFAVLTEEEKRIYPKGQPFVSRKDGTLVKSPKSGWIWYIENGHRRAFPNWDTFTKMGFSLDDVETISEEDLEQIFIGKHMPKLKI